MSDKQSQKAGDNALQVQVRDLVINNYYGSTDIDEKGARVIFQKKSPQAIENYTQEAEGIARLRIDKLESVLIPRMEVEDTLKAFADPSFQNLLVEAQKVAASTERQADYELLAELLTQWTQVKEDRMRRTALRGAVEIVGELADEALLGLTVLSYLPMTPILGLESIPIELEKWNKLLEQLLDSPLPQGTQWLEHLAVLRAVRIHNVAFPRTLKEKVRQALSGYVDVGILNGSDDHQMAISLLESAGLPSSGVLVEHDLNKDYLRVNLPHRGMIDKLQVGDSGGSMQFLTDSQKNTIERLYDLYVQDENLREQNVDKFIKEWDRWPTLRAMREWWESWSISSITHIGFMLAQANAERIGLLERRKPSA